MNAIAAELEMAIEDFLPRLNSLPQAEFEYKPSLTKWSKKEITGHLIDSAQNNLRRFVVAQYEENALITYDQDKWVTINNYQRQPCGEIIQLWYILNKQMVNILKNIPEGMQQRTSKTPDTHSIDWLASDYIKHLKHHLHQVVNLEPVAYP